MSNVMVIKIISSLLILFAVYMGVKQGTAMVSGKPAMLGLFGKWGIGDTGVMLLGLCTLAGALLTVFTKTFVYGNFITAAGILLIMAFHLSDRNLKGVATELPFLLLSLLIIYLRHPFPDLFKTTP